MAKKKDSKSTVTQEYFQLKLQEQKTFHEEKARRREALYRRKYLTIFNAITDPVLIYDALTYKFLHCNDSFTREYGYNREEILNMTPFDLHKPEEFESVRNNIEIKTTGKPNTYTHITKDRRQLLVEISNTDIYFEGQPAWMSIIHDITEQMQMQEELHKHKYQLEEIINERTIEVLIANKKLKQEIKDRHRAEQGILESEKKFKDIIEKFPDGVALVDKQGSIVAWNLVQEEIYGLNRVQVMGKKIWDIQFLLNPEEMQGDEEFKLLKSNWSDFLRTGKSPFGTGGIESCIERSDGQERNIKQLFFCIETETERMVVVATQDITQRLLMEKQLIQAQKMKAMGTLAGGIAHDFNNILAGIMGYTDLSIRKSEANAPIMKYLNQVLTASRRATDLVKQILTFSRPTKKEKEPLQLSAIVEEVLKLLRSSLPSTIEIVARIEAEDSFVFADATQFHQVIMNLCTNAGHAMAKNGGILEVRLNKEAIQEGEYKGLKEGSHLRLTVSDTGHGMKAEMLDKIFDPFFTTKKPGKGTGMGLAVVHGIINSHNGNISVFSKEGEGTSFSILLPIMVNVIHMEETKITDIPGGDERILLVEDDTLLADALKKLLEDLGYNVTAITSSVQALQIFSKVAERFDLVITDYTMPKLTGVQLTEKLHRIRPEIPVIMCSGHNDVLNERRSDFSDVIMKPIELAVLAMSIRRSLKRKN